ncbi:MAG: glycogen debranching enzyme family protein [Bacteroidales bacterium]|nr:glycogen debranching enzyme family protein [Bacteroidales bacterium]
MSYLNFDKQQLINLNYSLKRELIRSNRAGSYSSTTITFCNTRKYHGLLICPLEQLDGEKHVLISSLDETIIQHEREFHIGSRKYPVEYHPLGHKYIFDFHSEPIPTHVFWVGGVQLKKEILLSEEQEQILIRYTLVDAHSPTRIRFQPYLAFRQIHKLSKANMDVNTKYEEVENGIRVKLYNGYPFLYLQTSKKFDYIHAPDWYYNVQYLEEEKRGYESLEDLMAIGFFEAALKKGESIVFAIGTEEAESQNLKKRFAAEVKKRTPRSSFENNLENAAQQFFVKKNNKTYITAGFPWFGVWSRDTFISLPGLSLARNDTKTALNVLDTMSKELRNGLFPNIGTGVNADLNSVDAPLWYIWAIHKYVDHVGSFANIWKLYGDKMVEILSSYKRGTNYNIKMQDNGLIYAGEKGKALTWMDSVVAGKPVTPRIGFDVEVNALWYNAVMFVIEAARKSRKKEIVEEWESIPEKIKNSFIDVFWDNDKGYLADYVDENGKNWDVRPNQVIATSMPYSMLTPEQSQSVLKIIEKELLTSKGLRSLSPKNPAYKGRYEGDQTDRDLAYHQGTVWPWLLGHFVEGYLKIHEKRGLHFVEKLFHGFEEEMTNAGIGTISEIYDGDPPHEAGGAISQAWSVAEILRIKCLIDNYKK